MAFDCFIANKPVGAGSVGTETSTGFVPNKPNPGNEEQPHGAFVSFEEGGETYEVFIHGLLPPVREGGSQANCDGKGIDSLEACFGGEHE
ncbi:MAG: hypothetical protein GEU80_01540 [Dehalococcoidia bacterium]|nr:hypothetical protein [Dehalococcoidia bacterium]